MRSAISMSVLLLAAAACSKAPDRAADTTAMMAPSAANAGSPSGDSAKGGGMGMASHADTIGDRTKADLQAIESASGTAAVALVPAHAAVVNALIADCEKMMRDAKMKVPGKWTTTVADLRRDLDRMRTADASSLRAMVPAHAGRVRAMLSMRHDMMKMM